jgi:hypothetical protein
MRLGVLLGVLVLVMGCSENGSEKSKPDAVEQESAE